MGQSDGVAKIDMQRISAQSIVNPARFLSFVQQEKIKQQVPVWDQNKHRLLYYTPPTKEQSPNVNRRMKVQLTYLDKRTGQIKNKKISFCQGNEYIFTKDQRQRMRVLNSMKHKNNPLHHQYWRAIIGFAGPQFTQNVLSAMRPLIQANWRQIQQTKPRRDYGAIIQKRKATMMQRYGSDKPFVIHAKKAEF